MDAAATRSAVKGEPIQTARKDPSISRTTTTGRTSVVVPTTFTESRSVVMFAVIIADAFAILIVDRLLIVVVILLKQMNEVSNQDLLKDRVLNPNCGVVLEN
jgi:hypothetical protein